MYRLVYCLELVNRDNVESENWYECYFVVEENLNSVYDLFKWLVF